MELQTEVPQVQVEVDLAAAQRYGLKPGDVRRAAATLLAGEEVGDLFRDGKAYDVNVWSTPETRHSLTSIRDLLIDTPSGGHVRLGDVADVRIAPRSNVINARTPRGALTWAPTCGAAISAPSPRDVEQRLQTVKFPLGYHAEVLGEYAERQAAQSRCSGLRCRRRGRRSSSCCRLSFGSWRLATLAFLTLPSALVGGVLAASASAAASSRSARWSASSRSSGSPRATASC